MARRHARSCVRSPKGSGRLIGLDATYAIDRHPSGVAVYSQRLMAALAEVAPEAEFLAYYRPHRFLKSFRQPPPARFRRRLLWDRFAPRCRVFHGLNQRLPEARRGGCVATFHDLFVMTAAYSTPEFRARFAQLAREAASRAELIIAVSAFTGGQVAELLSVDPRRIRVIPHGVDWPEQVTPVAEREPFFLHVGALQERKNIVRLMEAFERAETGWRLVLAGASGYGAGPILERVERSPKRAAITVSGYVSAETAASLYQRAGALVFPSLDEGFGMPILEAMAQGLPVLTANRSATAEVAGQAALLVDPYRVEEMEAGLSRLASDAGLRCELAVRGRVRAREFPWRSAGERTWRVYEELGGSSRGARTDPR